MVELRIVVISGVVMPFEYGWPEMELLAEYSAELLRVTSVAVFYWIKSSSLFCSMKKTEPSGIAITF